MLKEWVVNKDRDLREREERRAAGDEMVGGSVAVNGYPSNERIGSLVAEGEGSGSTRKRIQMKRSIDTALNMLIASSTGLSDAYLKPLSSSSNNLTISSSTPPASPTKPFGEYSFYPVSPSDDGRYDHDTPRRTPIDPGARRPSLPHIMAPPPSPVSVSSSSRNRKTSISTNSSVPSPRRPRSAGAGAEREQIYPPFGRGGAGRKLGSKYSLLGLFKKGQVAEVGANVGSNGQSPEPTTPIIHQVSASVSLPGVTSASASTSNLPLSSSPQHTALVPPGPSSSSPNVNETGLPTSSGSPFSLSGFRFRMGSDTSGRARTPSQSQHHLPLPTSPQPFLPQSPLHPQPLKSCTPPSGSQPQPQSPPHPHIPSAVDLHNALAQHQYQTRDRSASAGSGTRFELPVGLGFEEISSSPLTRLGVLREHGHSRHRSGSRGSAGSGGGNRSGAVFDDDMVVPGIPSVLGGGEMSKTRPGILRGHNRSSSNGQGGTVAGSGSGIRALRFDSASSGSVGAAGRKLREGDKRCDSPSGVGGVGAGLRGSSSAGSLVKFKNRDAGKPGTSEATFGRHGIDRDGVPDSAPAAIGDFDMVPLHDDLDCDKECGEEEEYIYGHPIDRAELPVVVAEPKSQLTAAQMRERGLSFASSSDSSLSPMLSNGDEASMNGEFPFSINRPPPLPLEESDGFGSNSGQHLRVPSPGDNRGRGDSVSSTSTTDSHSNPQLSMSGTTSGSGSMTVSTPLLSPGKGRYLELPVEASPRRKEKVLDPQLDGCVDVLEATDVSANTTTSGKALGGLNKRRSHIPLDINISSISSHAQAEALVQRAQQDILEMAYVDGMGQPPLPGSAGWTPLSARLAAYGESLALERKLREQELAEAARMIGGQNGTRKKGGENMEKETEKNKQTQPQSQSKSAIVMQDGSTSPGLRPATVAGRDPRTAVGRGFGPEYKLGTAQSRSMPRAKEHRRPHTSSGTSTREREGELCLRLFHSNYHQLTACVTVSPSPANLSFASERSSRTHHASRSASAADSSSRPSTLSIDPDPDSPITPQSSQARFQSTTNIKIPCEDNSDAEYDHPIIRSYTPAPDPGHLHLSRISSIEGTDDTGSELFRVSTAPNTTSPVRGKRDHARHIASATKLTRMGFTPPDLAGRSPPANKRFGGLKSLMQSFKGKS